MSKEVYVVSRLSLFGKRLRPVAVVASKEDFRRRFQGSQYSFKKVRFYAAVQKAGKS